ncbi:LysE family translocator [Amphritea pacifica]|uniref:LysE family translocator n=1 Tax=Amphritea pacifica TaxID=2811233 RepID=UPI002FCDC8FA
MISVEFLLTSLVVVVMPGTGVLYTVATGLFVGKRASLFAASGCTLGIVPSLLASVFGLAAIFHTSVLAFQVVKYVGAAYLLYLAWLMWRSSAPLSLGGEKPAADFLTVATKGFLINILNPKLSIFFLAFLPQFLSPNAAQPLINMLLLGGGVYGDDLRSICCLWRYGQQLQRICGGVKESRFGDPETICG